MKTKSILFSGLFLLALAVFLSSFISKAALNPSRTEEYAIIDVIENFGTISIRVTKGSEPTTRTIYDKVKKHYDDFTPVINILNQLNDQGFELLSESLSYSTRDGGSSDTEGIPRQTFMMVKKNR